VPLVARKLDLIGHVPTLIRNGVGMTTLDKFDAAGLATTRTPIEILSAAVPLPDDAELVAEAPKDADAIYFAEVLLRHPQIVNVIRKADALEKALASRKAYSTLRLALNKALAPWRA
jgi:hypothetical protein